MSITYIRLSKEQKTFCEEFLRERVSQLKAYSPARFSRKFRIRVLQGEDNPDGLIPKKQMRKWLKVLPEIRAIEGRIHKCLGNRSVLQAIIEGYSNIVPKVINGLFPSLKGIAGYDDALQEGYISLIDAVYNYNKDVKFITYCYKVVRNHVQKYFRIELTDNKLLANKRNYDLYRRYRTKCSEVNRHVNFEEVAALMQLSEKERNRLSKILNFAVLNEFGDNEEKNHDPRRNSGDYTVMRSSDRLGSEYNWEMANNETREWSPFELDEMKRKLKKAIAQANFSPFEMDLLQTAKDPYRGWQSDVCKRNINPKTGKPYSRMAASVILPKIFEKLRRLMKEAA